MKDGTRIKATIQGQPCQGTYMEREGRDTIWIDHQGQWIVDEGSIEEIADGS